MATYDQLLPVYSTDQPEVHNIVKMMRKLVDSYEARMIIGEIYLPIHKLVAYYGVERKGAHLPFNFQLLTLPWDSRQIAAAIAEYEGALPDGGWPNWVLGNHDQPRVASRVGSSQARIAAMLLLTLRGTPTIYYGDEIGMRDVPIAEEAIRDPQGLNMPDKNLSRDPARTPMQWDNSENAGFTSAKPWLPIDRNFAEKNVSAQQKDQRSMLALYKKLIQLRQREPSLRVGNYVPVYADHQQIAYIRTLPGEKTFLVLLNLSHRPCFFRQRATNYAGTIIVSSAPELEGTSVKNTITLSGDEGVVIMLDQELK
jgi:alpha-glucosidase